jgi:hypothetical protein
MASGWWGCPFTGSGRLHHPNFAALDFCRL